MRIRFESGRELLRRWLKFNFVGAMGISVQLAGVELAGVLLNASPAVATALGVEAAVLHNFLWHEKFTWADRRRTPQTQHARRQHTQRRRRLAQFLWFNATTGAISITGNVLRVSLVQWSAHVPVVVANCVAIAACSVINFVVNDRIVFRRRRFSSADFPDMLLGTESSTK